MVDVILLGVWLYGVFKGKELDWPLKMINEVIEKREGSNGD